MQNIKSISYSYNNDSNNPITYFLDSKTVTTSLSYRDAIDIAYAVIDSLGGSYDQLDELVEKFEDDGIKIESII